MEPGPLRWWWTICPLSSLAWSSLLEGLTLHPFPWRTEVLPSAPWSWADLESWGGQEEMQKGGLGQAWLFPRDPVNVPGAALAEGWARRGQTRLHRWGHPQPSSLQRTTDTRGNKAKTGRIAQMNPRGCRKPLDSGVVCLPKLYWCMGSSSKTWVYFVTSWSICAEDEEGEIQVGIFGEKNDSVAATDSAGETVSHRLLGARLGFLIQVFWAGPDNLHFWRAPSFH